MDDSVHKLIELVLDQAGDFVPVRQSSSLFEEVFGPNLEDLSVLTDTLTRGRVAMIFTLNEGVFISQNTFISDNDEVEDLHLPCGHLVILGFDLLVQVARTGWGFALKHLLELGIIFLLLFVNHNDTFSNFELAIDDEVDFVGSFTFTVQELVSVQGFFREEFNHLFDSLSGEQFD